MLDWQQTKGSTSKLSKSHKNVGRIVFNPLEKVFPRKNTEPGTRLKTSSDFKGKLALDKHHSGLTSFDSHPMLKGSRSRGKGQTPSSNNSLRRESLTQKNHSTTFKLNHGMPQSAKNSNQSPIKIFVNIGDTPTNRFKKASASKDNNVSKEKDISMFLVKKPSAGIINLKLNRQSNEARGYSFEKDPKQLVKLPLEVGRGRRNSSRAIEKPADPFASNKTKPYISPELMVSSKKKVDLISSSKSKLKMGSGLVTFGDTEKENFRKGSSSSKSKMGLMVNQGYKSTQFQGKFLTSQPQTSTTSKPDLTNIVTQVNESDMNKLGDLYAEEPQELSKEEYIAEQKNISKKMNKKDFMQAKLPYYVGGVIIFFHDPKKDYFATLYKEHFRHTFASLKFCKSLMPCSSSELALKQRHYPVKSVGQNKRTLVLDLDETLIHCVTAVGQSADVYLPIRFPSGDTVKAPINVRPHAVRFLEQMSKLFELIVFTASNSCYADVVLDYLDPERKFISHRLYRESCVQMSNGMFIKDLRVIGGRDIEQMVLVDNASYSFGFQLEQGIPVVPFYDSKQDIELLALAKYLEKIAACKSMGDLNRKTFKLRDISDCFTVEDAYKLFTK